MPSLLGEDTALNLQCMPSFSIRALFSSFRDHREHTKTQSERMPCLKSTIRYSLLSPMYALIFFSLLSHR